MNRRHVYLVCGLLFSASVVSLTGLNNRAVEFGGPCGQAGRQPVVFATFGESEPDLRNIRIMAESIRTFAGKYKNAPVWAYLTETLKEAEAKGVEDLVSLDVNIKTSRSPEDAAWYYLSRKVFASADAESAAEGKAEILAWLDVDTVFLQEPAEFILPEEKTLGCRPVMHKNISPLFAEPLDVFWKRAYELMEISESSMFTMVTIADGDAIRPYINAGCLVVRPERGLLRKWAKAFPILYRDSALKEMCREDERKRLFIHQVALAGAVLKHLSRNEMVELSDKVNFPIFFKEMFGAKKDFRDIRGVISIRHEQFFKTAPPDWDKQLIGPQDKIAWLKDRFGALMKPE